MKVIYTRHLDFVEVVHFPDLPGREIEIRRLPKVEQNRPKLGPRCISHFDLWEMFTGAFDFERDFFLGRESLF